MTKSCPALGMVVVWVCRLGGCCSNVILESAEVIEDLGNSSCPERVPYTTLSARWNYNVWEEGQFLTAVHDEASRKQNYKSN